MKTCILAIQRYEYENDIKEWINHHISLRFNHIFLLDNNDESEYLNIDNNEYITIIPYYGQRIEENDWQWQRDAYNYALEKYIKNSAYDWLLTIDIDEFIWFNNYSNINDFITYECLEKNFNNIEIIWRLFSDNNIIFHQTQFEGNVQQTYTHSFEPTLEHVNSIYDDIYKKFNTKGYTKGLYKITDNLRYTYSSHFADIELYKQNIYAWNVCDPNICVIKHYKYKSLEEFISKKCLLRNYKTSRHASTWQYSRTYFEDNYITINKLLFFAMFDFKYKLNMTKFDIEYLHELLHRFTGYDKFVFDIWFGDECDNQIMNLCVDSQYKFMSNFYRIFVSESNVDLNICPYVKFMYDHNLYGMCADFFKCLFLYYFGGIYTDRDVIILNNIDDYYDNNDYMLFDSSFYNLGAWFTKDHLICSSFMMAKQPFNNIFKRFIDYCSTFTYEQLEDMYNKMSKKDFMDYFYDVKIFYYHVIKPNNDVICLNNINDLSKIEDNVIYVYDNILLEPIKYNLDIKKYNEYNTHNQIMFIHLNLKSHEKIYFEK